MSIRAPAVLAAILLVPVVASAAEPSPPPTVDEMRIVLGRRLFHEADLSLDGTLSCATCHEQKRGFADGNRTHPGIHGHPGRRNVPGLANVGRLRNLTWADDRLGSLERQALNPMTGTDPIEMGIGGHEAEVVERLAGDPCYRRLFAAAFPDGGGRPTMAAVTSAVAAFERTLISTDTAWDRAERAGAPLADPAAERGRAVFAAKGCATCHVPPLFTDDAFHVVRRSFAGETDVGLAAVTGATADRFAFRTPGLRDVALTAPYWHDGRAETPSQAFDLHDADGVRADLTAADRADLTAFLAALTDETLTRAERFSPPPLACPLP
ncbi:MAG: cytochrome-c peroxidase [Phyllobacteriaceae bacterium]|nr:cytochrome-c peroxidase [Phyllobacteriaceae bacterium]